MRTVSGFKFVLFLVLIPVLVFAGRNVNVTLLSHLDSYGSYNDCWGYSGGGREYAFLGEFSGVSIIDITDPAGIYEVAYIPGFSSGWRDMKTFQNYLYIVNESGGGLQIVDLSSLPTSAVLVNTWDGLFTSHNIFVDEPAGIMYAEGEGEAAVRVISLADPVNPVQLSTLGIECHDFYAANGRLFVAEGGQRSIGIYDVSNPAQPELLKRMTIPNSGYAHNVWVSADGNFMMTTEETAHKTVKMWDVGNLQQISLLSEYLGESKLAHNIFIKNNLAYLSHYTSGMKIIDISDPGNIFEVGGYDTYQPGDATTFRGAWGVYPFTANGSILISDMQSGLYVVDYNCSISFCLQGRLTDAQTGEPVNTAVVEIVENGAIIEPDSTGTFHLGYGRAGTMNLRVYSIGYETAEIQLNAVIGTRDSINIALQPPQQTGAVQGLVQDSGFNPQ